MFYPSLDIILGLSNPVKSRNPPKPPETRERRGKSITGHARRMVRSAAAIMEESHGKRNLSFLTLTLPDLPWWDMDVIRRDWPVIVKRAVEELSRELSRRGMNPEVVHVTEIQEHRYRKYGVIAPHIHAVFQGRKSGQKTWAIRPEKFTEIWERVIGNVLGRSIRLPAATNVQAIRNSVKRYLGKYMSKGGKIIKEIVENGRKSDLPASWWGVTHTLRKKVKEGIIEVDQEIKDLIVEHWEEYKKAGILRWGQIVTKEILQSHGEPIEIPICFCGEFASKEAMLMFCDNITGYR